MTSDAARSALLACCGARAWAEQMTALRPFEDVPALHRIAERVWWSLDEAAHREAFAAHPRIGELSASSPALDAETTGRWTREEQRGAASASERTAAELARLNRVYADKHGMIFLICATGRSAEAMLAELIQRVERPTAVEFRTAAEEQCKITRLRLTKLIAGNT
jgi:OHCU decarboxylase